jgi:hypothetical protein
MRAGTRVFYFAVLPGLVSADLASALLAFGFAGEALAALAGALSRAIPQGSWLFCAGILLSDRW